VTAKGAISNGADDPTVSPYRISALRLTYEELRARQASLLSQLRALMSETQYHRERLREGRSQRSATTSATQPPGSRLEEAYGMTPREAEVASLLAQGLSNSALARRLGISPHTARHHTQRVLGKLGAHSRAEAGAILRR
jgi:DNA-binding NarL/FixJ family response regulator